MLALETSACESASFLATLLFIKNIIKIISYIVPAILILLVSIDITKAVIANSDDEIKRTQKLAIKRIIAALIIFFVPIVVEVSFNMLGDAGGTWKVCYDNASDEVVSGLVEAENAKLIQKEKDRQEMIRLIKKEGLSAKQAKKKLIEKKRKESGSNGGGGQVIDIANREYKIWQSAGGSQRNKMILKYCKSCGEDSKNPWCAEFVNYSLIESGTAKKLGLSPFCSANEIYYRVKNGKAKALTIHKAGGSYVPKPGDMIIFNWDGDSVQDHIGLVEYVKKSTVHTIEGNNGDRVVKGNFSLSNGNIEAYISY